MGRDSTESLDYKKKSGHHCYLLDLLGFLLSVLYFIHACIILHFGIDRIDYCPYEDMIPIFMIIWGSMIIVSSFMRVIKFTVVKTPLRKTGCGRMLNSNGSHAIEIIWNIASFGVFIMGNYYVLEAYQHFDGFPPDNYRFTCDETVYELAFYTLVITWGVILFTLIFGIIERLCCCKK